MSDEIMRALGRVEGKLDGVVASIERQRVDIKDQEKRVRSLEKWRAGAHKVAVVLAAIGTAAAGYFNTRGN